MPMPHRQLLEPNSVADGYVDDRGMSCIPKIRNPSPTRPLAPLLGLLQALPPLRRSAMPEFSLRKYERLCMRFAAECEVLAADAPEPDLREHFLLMASMWTELADLPRVLH